MHPIIPPIAYIALSLAFASSLSANSHRHEERDGFVEIEAEDFSNQTLDDVRRWYIIRPDTVLENLQDPDPNHAQSASGRAYIECLPDTRVTHDDILIQDQNFTNTPGLMAVLSYPVKFNTPGRYWVWASAFSTGSEDNGLHVGLNGTWPGSGRRLQWCAGKHKWTWSSAQRVETNHCGVPNTIFLDVPSAGVHTFQISMREDGVEIDRFILVNDIAFKPDVSVRRLPPTAIAGANQVLTLPLNSTTLDGSNSRDSDGSIVRYAWQKLSGPSATLAGQNSAILAVSNMVEGLYVFELTVTDNDNLSAASTVSVTVSPKPTTNSNSSGTITATTSPTGMSLVWSDEFNYSGLPDESKWSYDVDGNSSAWGNNQLQNYTPRDYKNPNAWVENGKLIIEARKEPFSHSGHTRNYTSARLRTMHKGDWLYGRFEVRAKLPRGRGTWAAIWMLPTDRHYGNWPDSGEIDIMEHVGHDMNRIHGTVHTKSFNHVIRTQAGNSIAAQSADEQFHVYALEWRPGRIDVFVNNKLYFFFPNDTKGFASWPFDQRFHLLLNLAVGGSWGGIEGVDDSIFPQRMEIDYVRVYSLDDPYSGTVHLVPGHIASEQFSILSGPRLESTADIGGGMNLAGIRNSHRARYSLDATHSGMHELFLRYASPKGSTGLSVAIDNTTVLTKELNTATGGWQSWTTSSLGSLPLTAGQQTLDMEFHVPEVEDLNVNWMSLFPLIDAVHQFHNPNTGAYFFTAFINEARDVLRNLPQWRYQGLSFEVEYAQSNHNLPVYRFFNKRSGSHFYTASADERDGVIANLAHQYSYEGIAFFVRGHGVGPDPVTMETREFHPIWRCYLPRTASHYFTGNPDEVAWIREFVDPKLMYVEGIAWYSHRVFNL